MRVVRPDPSRMIDLPSVGPCPRPVDIDSRVTGFRDLLSLRLYDFAGGPDIEGEAEEDEVLVTLVTGAARFVALGQGMETAFDLSAWRARVAYLPPRFRYRLTPLGHARVAYARARPRGGAAAPAAFRAPDGRLDLDGPAERLRLRLRPLSAHAEVSADLGVRAERLLHLTGAATVRSAGVTEVLEPGSTVALEPGEAASAIGAGEALLIGAA